MVVTLVIDITSRGIYYYTNCDPDAWKFINIVTDQGTFNCYYFNNDTNNVQTSSNIGFSGSFSLLFEVENPPDDYSFRTGLQATFVRTGAWPDIYNEIRFASPGEDTFFGIQAVETTFQNESDPALQGPFVTYDTSYALTRLPVGLLSNRTGNNSALISVSFAFQTLNLQKIVYSSTYSVANLLGDFAGVVGTVLGLDLMKLLAGIPVAILAARKRDIGKIVDHFSG